MYTGIKTYSGQNSITKYATHIRQIKISVKHLIKLRKKYRNFELTEFGEWHFHYSLTTQLNWFQRDLNYYKYYNWPQYGFAIFRSSDRTYDKWFKSTCKIFNGINSKPLSIFGDLIEAKKVFNKNVNPIKNLIEKIGDQSKLMLEQKNYFLYDDSNIINHTFYTELNRKVQTYGLISTTSAGTSLTHMITPQKSLKFKAQNEEYKENIAIQLEKITKEESIKVQDNKVSNFSILATRGKKKVGNKRLMPHKIIDQVKIGGLQNFDTYEKLNPVDISIRDSKINSFLARYRRYKYWFVIDNLLFSSALTNNTNIIFVSCNGLNEVKELLINSKLFETLGVIKPSEIDYWDKVKGKSKWKNAVFTDFEDSTAASHFAFAFTLRNLHDILNFEFSLLDDEAKLINFPGKEDKVPVLTFTIEIVK